MTNNIDAIEVEEFLTEKEYALSSEVIYTNKAGLGCKTKKVKLLAIKIKDGVEVSNIITNNEGMLAGLEKIITRGYIVPCEDLEGVISVSSFHFRTARELFTEYSDNFF